MVTITSAQSGNWSSTNTWVGGVVPANTNDVIIAAGHDVIVDGIVQSGFTNGLGNITIQGILRFQTDAVSYLKLTGNIAYTGSGKMYIGNSESDPIQRPNVGSANRITIDFNSNNGYTTVPIECHAWNPGINHTTLSADASLNATELVLTDDLNLQQGDIIVVGCGNVKGKQTEGNKGIYTVQSYNVGTKTVTLTSALQTARKGALTYLGVHLIEGDYVAYISRPIKVDHSVQMTTGTIFQGSTVNLRGVDINQCTTFGSAVTLDNCTIRNPIGYSGSYSGLFNILNKCTAHNCVTQKGAFGYNAYDMKLINCIAISCDMGLASHCTSTLMIDCIQQNCDHGMSYGGKTDTLIRCKAKDCSSSSLISYGSGHKIIDCREYGGDYGILEAHKSKLYNCLLLSTNKISYSRLLAGHNIEHFDADQNVGNYWAGCLGGYININEGKLRFNCSSSSNYIFRDYVFSAPANRTIRFLINLLKSIAGINVKLQLIDSANDPLIDSTATPLAESTAQNNTSEQQVGIAYKSDIAKQLILRILVQNSSGTVDIDVTRIEQMLQKTVMN